MKRGARWNRCVEQTSQKMTALSLSRFQYAKLPPGAIDGAFLGDLFYALSPHAVHVLGLSDPAAEWKCVWQVPPHRRYVPGYSREAFLKSAPPDRKPHLQFYRLYATAAHLFVLTEWEPVAPAKAVDATPGRLNSKRIFRIDGPELVPVNTPFSAPFDVRCDDADFFVRKDGVVYEYDAAGRMVARIAFHVGKPGGVVVTRLDGSEPAEQVFALADLSGAEIQRVDFQRRMVLAFTSASRIVAYNAATKQVVPGLSPCHRHLGAGSRMACGALPGTLGVHLGLRTDTYDLKEVDVKKLISLDDVSLRGPYVAVNLATAPLPMIVAASNSVLLVCRSPRVGRNGFACFRHGQRVVYRYPHPTAFFARLVLRYARCNDADMVRALGKPAVQSLIWKFMKKPT